MKFILFDNNYMNKKRSYMIKNHSPIKVAEVQSLIFTFT